MVEVKHFEGNVRSACEGMSLDLYLEATHYLCYHSVKDTLIAKLFLA